MSFPRRTGRARGKKPLPKKEPTPIASGECYGEYDSAPRLLRDAMRLEKPSCVNTLTYRRYRVTVERIEEPAEVLIARLLELFNNDNPSLHRYDDFVEQAKELGYKLTIEGRTATAEKMEEGPCQKST